MALQWSACYLFVLVTVVWLMTINVSLAAVATTSDLSTNTPNVTLRSTTLRHLQVLFRHGDRAPLSPLFPNDPFGTAKYWPHGLDQLTTSGRARMFRLGQMLRANYNDYLGQEFSPREISARSSAIDRCLESAQLVLAGAYPPNSSSWQWDVNGSPLPLARVWQPIPVASFLPPNDDSLLRTKKPCPKAESERHSIITSPPMIELLKQHKDLLREVTDISGYTVDDVLEADRFHENLAIEHENGFYWSDHLTTNETRYNWTREHEVEVLRKLTAFSYARWNNEWNSTLIKRVRAGELLVTIGDNFHQKRSVLDLENDDQNKLVLFSSHDTKVAALLFALDVWNDILIPYSTSIIFELHQSVVNQTNFYVLVRYYNETMSLLDANSTANFRDSYALKLPACAQQTVQIDGQPMCPLERFIDIVQGFKVNNWDLECGIDSQYSNGTYLVVINILLLIANLVILFALLLLVMYFCTKIKSRTGYQRLE